MHLRVRYTNEFTEQSQFTSAQLYGSLADRHLFGKPSQVQMCAMQAAPKRPNGLGQKENGMHRLLQRKNNANQIYEERESNPVCCAHSLLFDVLCCHPAPQAAAIAVPATPALKDPKRFAIVSKWPTEWQHNLKVQSFWSFCPPLNQSFTNQFLYQSYLPKFLTAMIRAASWPVRTLDPK